MPAKSKPAKVTHEPVQPTAQPSAPVESDPVALISEMAGSGKHTVRVYRRDPRTQQENYITAVDASGFGLDWLSNVYGGGDYKLQICDAAGRVVKNLRTGIEGPPKRVADLDGGAGGHAGSSGPPAQPASAPTANAPGPIDWTAILVAQMNTQATMMSTMMQALAAKASAPAPNSGGNLNNRLVEILLAKAVESPTDKTAQILELADKLAARSTGTSDIGEIAQLLGGLGSLIGPLKTSQAAKPAGTLKLVKPQPNTSGAPSPAGEAGPSGAGSKGTGGPATDAAPAPGGAPGTAPAEKPATTPPGQTDITPDVLEHAIAKELAPILQMFLRGRGEPEIYAILIADAIEANDAVALVKAWGVDEWGRVLASAAVQGLSRDVKPDEAEDIASIADMLRIEMRLRESESTPPANSEEK